MKTFKELKILQSTKKAIENLGFDTPTPIQENAIPHIIESKDLIALAHTGSGKTLAFGIGVIEKIDPEDSKVQALILCPTRELVMQTSHVLADLLKYHEKIKVLSIFGGQQIARQIVSLKKRPQIIIGTPGRVIDHLKRRTLRLNCLKILVLDEADEMLDMGFRKDLDHILSLATTDRQTLLFSATMSKDIENIAEKYQKDALLLKIGEEDLIPKIKQSYISVKDSKNKDQVLSKMLEENKELSIIFCNTKRKVDTLKKLLEKKFMVEALHGDMRQNQRHAVMKIFKAKKIDALITTDVAARGIDVNDIKRVINYDFPQDPKYYVHRIGRTARAGKDGTSITFITEKEKRNLKILEKEIGVKIDEMKPDFLKDIIVKDVNKEVKEQKTSNKETKFLNKNELETRLFISIGKLDKITGSLLKELIIKGSKIKDEDITNIEVFEKFSFFTVNSKKADLVIKTFLDSSYNGRRVGIEISNKPNTKFKKGNNKYTHKRKRY